MDGIHIFPSTVARHEAAPLLREREKYLAYLKGFGLKRRRLCSASAMLVQIVNYLGMTEARQVTLGEVNAAGTAWCNTASRSWPPLNGPHSRKEFEGKARQFLRFSGLLLETPLETNQFSTLLTSYLEETTRARRLSVATRDTARLRLRRFLQWLAPRRSSLALATVDDIDAYLQLKRTSCSLKTLSGEAAALQDFFLFAEDHGWCSGIREKIVRPRSPKPHYYADNRLQWADVRRLLTSLRENSSSNLRARAMILLCALYGLRSSEVARLRIESFNWEENTFSLTRAKRGRAQHYPVLPELRDAIQEYLTRGRPQTDNGALFISVGIPYRQVCPAIISYIVRARISALGITASPAGAHALRHACASELLRTGSSLQEIADFLGHRNLRTVSCYVRHDEAALREVASFDMGLILP